MAHTQHRGGRQIERAFGTLDLVGPLKGVGRGVFLVLACRRVCPRRADRFRQHGRHFVGIATRTFTLAAHELAAATAAETHLGDGGFCCRFVLLVWFGIAERGGSLGGLTAGGSSSSNQPSASSSSEDDGLAAGAERGWAGASVSERADSGTRQMTPQVHWILLRR